MAALTIFADARMGDSLIKLMVRLSVRSEPESGKISRQYNRFARRVNQIARFFARRPPGA